MSSRFQTPRKVPGSSIKNMPLTINAVTRCWLCRSDSMRAASATATGWESMLTVVTSVQERVEQEGCFQGECAGAYLFQGLPAPSRERGRWCMHRQAADSYWSSRVCGPISRLFDHAQ